MVRIIDGNINCISEDEIIERTTQEVRCNHCGNDTIIPIEVLSSRAERALNHELEMINSELEGIRNIINNSEIPYYLRINLTNELEKIQNRRKLRIVR